MGYLKVAILFCWMFDLLAVYSDPELDKLWSSVSDINNPSLSDYLLIDDYLKNGERPYLDPLRLSMFSESLGSNRAVYHRRMDLVLNFKLLGPNQEMPLFEIHKINVRKETEKRCIVLYASQNGPYPERARRFLSDLKKCRYSGHVLLRIGGFPNTPNGGLKICCVPYAFKVAFLREAQILGYSQVLWVDTSLHPLNDLEMLFKELDEKGYFFMSACTVKASFVGHMQPGLKALSVSEASCDQIPHIYSPVLGLGLRHDAASSLLDGWYAETENILPYMTPFHEDLSLSAIAAQLKMIPHFSPGQIICLEREVFEPFQLQGRVLLHFYSDSTR